MRKPPFSRAPELGEGKRGKEGYLGYLLRQAGVAHRGRMERALAALDVTPPQFVVLTMVANYPGLSNADLARLSLLTPQTMSVIVGNLLRTGALARRPHAVHGRIQHLEVTEAGKSLLARCREPVRTIETQLVAGLSPQEEQTIRKWLVAIAVDTVLPPETATRSQTDQTDSRER
jgi:DNA-binding MarR family transcriptional regulator